MLRYVHVLRLVVWEVSVGRRMCDFTRSSAASTAEHSHVYGKDLKRGEAVIRSFTVPQIRSAISLSDSPSNTHTSVYRISSLPPPTHRVHPPTPFHPHSGSSRHHLSSSATPEKPIQTAAPHRHGMLAKGDGVLSGSRLQPPSPSPSPPPLPPRSFSTFPQHAWCISGVARQPRQDCS